MERLHSDVRGVLDLEPEAVRARNRTRDPRSDYIDSWGTGQSEGFRTFIRCKAPTRWTTSNPIRAGRTCLIPAA
jgi:hypothetical protein